MEFLAWIENTAFSTWVRESNSPFGYTLVLYLHSIGLGLLVGFSTVIGLRIFGFAPRLPLAPMAKLFPFMFVGFWLCVVTGAVLLMIAVQGFLTNVVFYVKLGAVIVGAVFLRRLNSQVFGDLANLDTRPLTTSDKAVAGALLAVWGVAVVAGRLTAYHTYTVLSTVRACLVSVVLLAVAILITRYVRRHMGWSDKPLGEDIRRHPSVAHGGR